jgi:hypothetical protein
MKTKPKLAILPGGWNTSYLYPIIPTGSRMYFNRPATATKINKDGIIVPALFDHPRINWATKDCPTILFESESTNEMTYSNDFTYWLKNNFGGGVVPVVTPNYAVSPEGKMNATRAQIDTNNTVGAFSTLTRVFENNTIRTLTCSIWLKSNTEESYDIRQTFAGNVFSANVGKEWERFSWTVNDTPTGSQTIGVGIGQLDSTPMVADVLYYGFQIEEQVAPTSYIPTLSTTITRSRDLAETSLLAFEGDEGTFYGEIDTRELSNDKDDGFIQLKSANYSILVRIFFRSFSGTKESGVTLTNGTSISDIIDSNIKKVAVRWKDGVFQSSINGIIGELGTDNTPVRVLTIDGRSVNGSYGIKKVLTYSTRLDDNEFKELTK